MAIVTVKIPANEADTRKPVRDLFWYDTKHKKMLKFQGERLEFDYKFDASLLELGEPKEKCFRLVPRLVKTKEQVLAEQQNKVIEAKTEVVVKNRDSRHIMRWFRDYKNYNDSEAEILPTTAKKDSVSFEVPDEELEAFLDDLDSNRFKYSVL